MNVNPLQVPKTEITRYELSRLRTYERLIDSLIEKFKKAGWHETDEGDITNPRMSKIYCSWVDMIEEYIDDIEDDYDV